MTIDIHLKVVIFDRQVAVTYLSQRNRYAQEVAGRETVETARQSLRSSKGSSRPHTPPNSHNGRLRDRIYFSFDDDGATMVIGPALEAGSKKNPEGQTVPSVLERGGIIVIQANARRHTPIRQVRILDRAFMGPALEQSNEKYPEAFGR